MIICAFFVFSHDNCKIQNNMKKSTILLLMVSAMIFATSCNGQKKGDEGTTVRLQTTAGDIVIRLYDDTPGHRDNFLQNVRDSLYNGVTFHRVIRNFMIQTGDPHTRPGQEPADTNELGPMIPAEVRYPQHYHKRGVVAAAREGDDVNPEKQSDKYQFYIVTGRNYTDEQLSATEEGLYDAKVEEIYNKYVADNQATVEALRKAREHKKLSDYLDSLLTEAKYYVSENPPAPIPAKLKRDYKMYGGAVHLDRDYTVFGEVIEGMKVVDDIQKVKTDAEDVPLRDIRVIKATIQ